jgi:hypothetical protein
LLPAFPNRSPVLPWLPAKPIVSNLSSSAAAKDLVLESSSRASS